MGGRATGAAPGVESRRGGKSSAHAGGELAGFPACGVVHGQFRVEGGKSSVQCGRTAGGAAWVGAQQSPALERCPGTGWRVTASPQQEGEPGLRADAEHWGGEASGRQVGPSPGGHLEGGDGQTWQDTAGRCPVPPWVPGRTGSLVAVRDGSGVNTAREVGEGWSSRRGSSRAVCPATSWEPGHRRLFPSPGQGWP